MSVVLVDQRARPGGHWNDSYPFVTLHQPCRNYGVESRPMEDGVADRDELRATRDEILQYYSAVLEGFAERKVTFVPSVAYDFATRALTPAGGAEGAPITVDAQTVVDCRWTENDLPVFVPPKFAFDAEAIDLIPPNELPARREAGTGREHYCVLGAGKTGQDTVIYLQEQLNVPPENIAWVMPTDPWITARDPPQMDTCMEFIDVCVQAATAAGVNNPHDHS